MQWTLRAKQKIGEAIVIAATLGIVWGGLPACRGCEPEDDEKLIRALVAQAVERAEKHDVSGLFDLATKSFTANPGSHDRRSSKAILMMMFRQYGSFHITHPVYGVEIAPTGEEAELSIPFLVVREGQSVPNLDELLEQPARWLEEASKVADPFMMNAHLVKEDGDWKVATARVTGRRSVGL